MRNHKYWWFTDIFSVFLSALSLKSDFRMLMLLRPFPALGNLFKSSLLLLNTAKKVSELYSLWWKERSLFWEIRRAVLLVEMVVRSLQSDYLKMLFDSLIWKRSLYMFGSAFFVLVPIKKLPVCLFLAVYFLHPDRNKGNDPFSFPSLSLTGMLFLAEDSGMARSSYNWTWSYFVPLDCQHDVVRDRN